MFQSWKWLRVGLMTLVVVGAALALLLSVVEGGKPAPPPPPPPVTYTMRLMPPLPEGTSLYAAGMNNHGQVVAWGYLWKTANDEVINLADLILNDASIEIVPSDEFRATLPKDPDTGKPILKWPPRTINLRFESANPGPSHRKVLHRFRLSAW